MASTIRSFRLTPGSDLSGTGLKIVSLPHPVLCHFHSIERVVTICVLSARGLHNSSITAGMSAWDSVLECKACGGVMRSIAPREHVH